MKKYVITFIIFQLLKLLNTVDRAQVLNILSTKIDNLTRKKTLIPTK